MQEGCEDFYEICETGGGCCLNCYDSYDGCLCYDCKCKQCFWYTSPENYNGSKGHCDKTDELKEEKKEEIKLKYQEQDALKLEKSKVLEKENKRVLKLVKEKKEIPNYYTCQKCKREFTTKTIYKIILNEKPLCLICN